MLAERFEKLVRSVYPGGIPSEGLRSDDITRTYLVHTAGDSPFTDNRQLPVSSEMTDDFVHDIAGIAGVIREVDRKVVALETDTVTDAVVGSDKRSMGGALVDVELDLAHKRESGYQPGTEVVLPKLRGRRGLLGPSRLCGMQVFSWFCRGKVRTRRYSVL